VTEQSSVHGRWRDERIHEERGDLWLLSVLLHILVWRLILTFSQILAFFVSWWSELSICLHHDGVFSSAHFPVQVIHCLHFL
jgi:hypothetical protein